MILGNDKKFNNPAFICYLDILGFSSDILNNWGKNPDPLSKILSIKDELKKFEEMKVDDEIKASFSTYFIPFIRTVSDSIIICFGFGDKSQLSVKYFNPICGLRAVLSDISKCWVTAIMNGYTIRGAIDLGEVYWDENDLIGPAFIEAYSLNQKMQNVQEL